jgi:hypothetical protein
MKKTKIILLFFSFLLLFAFSSTALAAGIVPCGDTTPCTLCHLIVGIKNLVDWGLKIALPLAVLGIVISGILYMVSAGNSKLIETAKTGLWAGLIGFTIVLAAWLIVNVVITMLSGSGSLGQVGKTWNSFSDCN